MQIVAVTDPLQVGFRAAGDDRASASRATPNASPTPCSAMPEVDYVVTTAGSFDLLAEVVCEDDDHLLDLLSQRIRTLPGVQLHRDVRLSETQQAELRLGYHDDHRAHSVYEPSSGLRTPSGALYSEAARDHLWMHFTRHSTFEDRRRRPGHVPIIVRGEGAYIWDDQRQASTSTGSPGCSSSRSATAARSWPRPPPSRPASWRSSRSGPTRTRGRSSWPSGSPTYAPGDLNRVFFTTGGGEAVETAWKLAKQYFKLVGKPTKHKVISRAVAYHGTPQGALSITGIPGAKEMFEPLVPGAFKVPNTNFYRAPEHLRDDPEGLRAVGRRPHRRGDRVRGPGHRRRGLPGAGAELRRLLPAAARLLPAGPRDLRRVRRAARLRRGHLRVRPHRRHVRLQRLRLRARTSSPAPRA